MLDNKFVRELKFLIREVLAFNYPTDKLLSNYFREHKKLSSQERNIIAETAYTILRNYYKIIANFEKDDILSIIGLVWVHFLKLQPAQYQMVTLIDFSELTIVKQGSDEQSIFELPSWIIELLRKYYSEEQVTALSHALQVQAPLDLRVNIQKTDVKSVIQVLEHANLNPIKTRYSPYAIRLSDKTFLNKNKLFIDGKIEVQDESSQIAGILLNPKRGDMIVDFCAGAGGKTLLFGMLMRNTGRIYAFDVNEKRLNKLTPRLAKSGLSNVHPQLISSENDLKIKRLHNKIDRVFVDAPCSGLGTLRRNPELKFRQTPETIAELYVKQLSILTSASKLLKVGGYLVYATCSILYEENQDIVDKFLSNNSNFIKLNAGEYLGIDELIREDGCLVLLPNVNQTDGFFGCLLQRIR